MVQAPLRALNLQWRVGAPNPLSQSRWDLRCPEMSGTDQSSATTRQAHIAGRMGEEGRHQVWQSVLPEPQRPYHQLGLPHCWQGWRVSDCDSAGQLPSFSTPRPPPPRRRRPPPPPPPILPPLRPCAAAAASSPPDSRCAAARTHPPAPPTQSAETVSALRGAQAECVVCFDPMYREPVGMFLKGNKRSCRHFLHFRCFLSQRSLSPHSKTEKKQTKIYVSAHCSCDATCRCAMQLKDSGWGKCECPVCRTKWDRVMRMPNIDQTPDLWFKVRSLSLPPSLPLSLSMYAMHEDETRKEHKQRGVQRDDTRCANVSSTVCEDVTDTRCADTSDCDTRCVHLCDTRCAYLCATRVCMRV